MVPDILYTFLESINLYEKQGSNNRKVRSIELYPQWLQFTENIGQVRLVPLFYSPETNSTHLLINNLQITGRYNIELLVEPIYSQP